MSKKFIVKTPFGIGVATSEEDLKELLESLGVPARVERQVVAPSAKEVSDFLYKGDEMLAGVDLGYEVTTEEALSALKVGLDLIEGLNSVVERSEEEGDACDCENCQANIKRLNDFKATVANITDGYILDVMEQDIHEQMERATPNTRVHLQKAFRIIHERNNALMQSVADGIGEAVSQEDDLPKELSKQMDAVAEKLLREEGPELSFGQYVHRFMSALADEMNATGEDAGDERSESQQGSSLEDILSMIFGEPKQQGEETQGNSPDLEGYTLESISQINNLDELTALKEELSKRSLDIANRKRSLEDEDNELNILLDAVTARKTVVKAGNAGEARAKVREQFTALESVLNDASMKTSVSDEVFKEVARLKEKFSI